MVEGRDEMSAASGTECNQQRGDDSEYLLVHTCVPGPVCMCRFLVVNTEGSR